MSMVFKWMLSNWGFCLFVLGIFVQITPAIKFSPITWLGNLLLGSIREDIHAIRDQVDNNEKDRIRWEVLDFSNSCRNGIRHTKDEFQHIIDLHDKYVKLLEKTHDTNGVFTAEYEYIKRLYVERQEKNDFL